MKIYFDSREHAIKEYPNYKPVDPRTSKIRTNGQKKYHKLGSEVISHKTDTAWKIGRFFKTIGLALLFPALCFSKYRKLLSRSWKEFKRGEETVASIYVKQQLDIKREDPTKKSLKVDKPEVNKPDESVLPKQENNWDEIRQDPPAMVNFVEKLIENVRLDKEHARDELLDVMKKITATELNILVESEKPLAFRSLLTLFSMHDKVEFSEEIRRKICKRVEKGLEQAKYGVAHYFRYEINNLIYLLPFNTALFHYIHGLSVQSFMIENAFSYHLNDIPDEFLRKSLELSLKGLKFNESLKPYNEYKEQKQADHRQIIPKGCQDGDLNLLSNESLSQLIIYFDLLETILPNIEDVNQNKLSELVIGMRKENTLRSLINLIGRIPNEEQRDAKLASLFLELEETELFLYTASEKKLEDALLNILYGCRDTNHPKCKNGLDILLGKFRQAMLNTVEDFYNKIMQKATIEQIIYLLLSKNLAYSGIKEEDLLSHAISKNVQLFVEKTQDLEDLKSYLETLSRRGKESLNNLFIRELTKQDNYRILPLVFADLSLESQKALIQFLYNKYKDPNYMKYKDPKGVSQLIFSDHCRKMLGEIGLILTKDEINKLELQQEVLDILKGQDLKK